MTPREIRAELGLDPHNGYQLRHSLANLRRKGSVEATGWTNRRTYTATKVRPFIRQRRANTLEQEMGLARGRVLGLHAIALKRWGKPYRPRPRHPLEQAMGYGV